MLDGFYLDINAKIAMSPKRHRKDTESSPKIPHLVTILHLVLSLFICYSIARLTDKQPAGGIARKLAAR